MTHALSTIALVILIGTPIYALARIAMGLSRLSDAVERVAAVMEGDPGFVEPLAVEMRRDPK